MFMGFVINHINDLYSVLVVDGDGKTHLATFRSADILQLSNGALQVSEGAKPTSVQDVKTYYMTTAVPEKVMRRVQEHEHTDPALVNPMVLYPDASRQGE